VSRDSGWFLQDILEACAKVNLLVQNLDEATFSQDWRTRDAVLHNLEVIGEAVKRLPDDRKAKYPAIPWRRIAGFRDVLVHAYFSLDDAIVWDVAVHHLTPLAAAAVELLGELVPV
jgi:uncharacterized protein with HEPN domain